MPMKCQGTAQLGAQPPTKFIVKTTVISRRGSPTRSAEFLARYRGARCRLRAASGSRDPGGAPGGGGGGGGAVDYSTFLHQYSRIQ